jgi:hypothetical protein
MGYELETQIGRKEHEYMRKDERWIRGRKKDDYASKPTK